jgi:hypothetical protein
MGDNQAFTHGLWLVHDADTFPLNPGASIKDRALSFGLTHKEWSALYFDALGVDRSGYDHWAQQNPDAARGTVISSFADEIEGFPLLSRINSYLIDIVFERDEIEQLKQECLKARELTSNKLAQSALEKLLTLCNEAQTLSLNIYFLAH